VAHILTPLHKMVPEVRCGSIPVVQAKGALLMRRRTFLKSLAAAVTAGVAGGFSVFAAVSKMKITRVRAYLPPNPNPLINQSDMVVTIETDAGITGIGEG